MRTQSMDGNTNRMADNAKTIILPPQFWAEGWRGGWGDHKKLKVEEN